ncbi:MAG: hypothetical protein ACI8RD_008161 [Bacillariaceae sp.]|jgi:hypothetical protein
MFMFMFVLVCLCLRIDIVVVVFFIFNFNLRVCIIFIPLIYHDASCSHCCCYFPFFESSSKQRRRYTGDVVSIPSPPTSNHRHVNLPNAQGSIIYIQKLMKLLLSLLTVSILSLQIEFCYALQASSHSLFIEHHHNLIISQTMKKNII